MPLLPVDGNGKPIQVQDADTTQTLALTTVSAQSAVFTEKTLVELYCDSTCFVAEGANPTATTSSLIVIGGIPRYKIIEGGNKIAAILASGADNLRITYQA